MDFRFPQRFPRTVAVAHAMLAPRVRHGDTVLDATAGNGHDTVFLADLVGDNGCVISVDIQASAIDATHLRCERLGLADRVQLICDSHTQIGTILSTRNISTLSAAVFNLGYLPGGDKSLVTHPDTTITALDQTLSHLSPGGLLLIVCYPGHREGAVESDAVNQWASSLDEKKFLAVIYRSLNQSKRPPLIIAVEHRSE